MCDLKRYEEGVKMSNNVSFFSLHSFCPNLSAISVTLRLTHNVAVSFTHRVAHRTGLSGMNSTCHRLSVPSLVDMIDATGGHERGHVSAALQRSSRAPHSASRLRRP